MDKEKEQKPNTEEDKEITQNSDSNNKPHDSDEQPSIH